MHICLYGLIDIAALFIYNYLCDDPNTIFETYPNLRIVFAFTSLKLASFRMGRILLEVIQPLAFHHYGTLRNYLFMFMEKYTMTDR
jgi:hypothetical protein